MEHRIEIADRLAVIADEVQGVAEALSVIRENEELHGSPANHILLLQHCTEKAGNEIRSIAGKI